PTSTRCSSTGPRSSGMACTGSVTWARCWPRRSGPCGDAHRGGLTHTAGSVRDLQEVGVSHLVAGIGELSTQDPAVGTLHGAAVVVEDGRVAWVGAERDAPAADRRTDLGGRAVVPGFVDSHAHLVFAGDRSAEFAARMAGERYDGGGIAATVGATRAATDDDLR